MTEVKESTPEVTSTTPEEAKVEVRTPTPQERLLELKKKQKLLGLSLKETIEKDRIVKGMGRVAAQQKHFSKMIQGWQDKQSSTAKKLMRQVKILADTIGKNNFKMLKDLYTVQVPEQKDEQGNVTQSAKTEVNYQSLLVEGRYVIVLEREARIAKKLRKGSSGRSSDRKNHQNTLGFINKRNQSIAAKEEAK